MDVHDEPEIDTGAGRVRGALDGRCARFLGIPFAEAPTGERRFLPPVPRARWDGVRDATAYGPTPQLVPFAEVTAIPEPSIPGDDVLSLNVFAPWPVPAEPLPVLVWIHGGGYVAGSPASPWYDGTAFVRDGVILVTIAYRLGFDGFGWLPDALVNRGVLDQVLALEWVREHIRAFGGDPERVTIGGQSAGGGSVLTLMTTPAARDLFAGAASFSGAPADIPLTDARASTIALADRLGVTADRAGFASLDPLRIVAAQTGEDLDAVPGGEGVLRIARGLVSGRPYGPTLDGDLLTTPVADALESGEAAEVPLLLGATTDEFHWPFRSAAHALADIDPVRALSGAGLDEAVAERYARELGRAEAGAALGAWVTDAIFRGPTLQIARARGTAPTWVYDFGWRSAVTGDAEHCLDVPFVFDVLQQADVARLAGPNPPQALADAMHGALVRFVRTGDPGWEPFATAETVHGFGIDDAPASEAYRTAAALLP